MKKILFALLLTGLLYSCEDAINSDDNVLITKAQNAEYLMPLTSGSYWIYETKYTDINGNSFTVEDSVFARGEVIINGNLYYEMHMMRADTLFSQFYLGVIDNEILLHSRMLHPFLDLDTTMCFSESDPTSKALFTNKNNWTVQDSFPGAEIPSIVKGENGPELEITLAARSYNCNASIDKSINLPVIPIDYDNDALKGVNFSGIKKFEIIMPDDAKFKSPKGCPLEDERVISSGFDLEIVFCADIGILYYDGFSEINVMESGNCTAMKTNSGKLIRYHLEK